MELLHPATLVVQHREVEQDGRFQARYPIRFQRLPGAQTVEVGVHVPVVPGFREHRVEANIGGAASESIEGVMPRPQRLEEGAKTPADGSR